MGLKLRNTVYMFGLWLVLLIITTTWLLGDTTFLSKGGGHECTRPTPIQLATVVSSQQHAVCN